MQNSRLGRMGKQTLKNRSNFTLLQQINPQQFANDQPIKNSNTLYLDQNGRQTQFSQLVKSSLYRRPIKHQLELDQTQANHKDMYALPVVNTGNSGSFVMGNQKSKGKAKLIKSQYLTDRAMLDSVQEVDQSGISDRRDPAKSLLSIKRPKAFQRRNKFQQIDFIGDNLYQVEDIIKDIGKIIDKTKRSNYIAPTKQPKTTLKSNKWLNNNFGNLSKLDQMLLSYTTSEQKQRSIPIMEDYYRQSDKQPNDKMKVEDKSKSKINSFSFGNRGKNNEYKLSLAVIKWSQLPMIGSKWQPEVYLKLQSYPQQEQYRKVVLKAYSLKIKTYSIFWQADAGMWKPKAANDKNTSSFKLMSQQEYAKTWEQKYPGSTQQLGQQQKQLLMQFDIEWYRTIIQLCYHSGLEDLLQKQYDITTYQTIMKSIEREDTSAELILRNQLRYLREYFTQVYTYTANETTIGLIRINNDDQMTIEDVEHNFQAMLNGENGGEIGFCTWPMSEDNSSFVVLLQLCGQTAANRINFNNQQQKVQLKMSNPNYTLRILPHTSTLTQSEQSNCILIKNNQENDWQIFPKIKHDTHNNLKYGIKMTQELLFGLLYTVNVNKI